MARILVSVALAALSGPACFEPNSAVCSDGRVCRAGTVCVPTLDLCVDPDRVDVCAPPAEDGDPCATDEIGAGTCSDGVCFPSGCGNGVVDEGEVCDDGNTRSGDGCRADCLSNELCGNAVVDDGEQCDCGVTSAVNPDCTGPNSASGGLCRPDCQLHCGDGIVGANELCDVNALSQPSCLDLDGARYDRGTTTCSASCIPAIDDQTCRYIGWRHRGPPATDVAPAGDGQGFFVLGSSVGRYTAYEPVVMDSASELLMAVWAGSTAVAVAVGSGGVALHYDATSDSWNEMPAAALDLHDVWGRAADDVFAVGDGGTIVHWDGTAWTTMPAPTSAVLHGVSGHGAVVYAVGDAGTVLRLDAGTWELVDAGTSADLRAVAVTSDIVAAVGAGGTIVENRGNGWAPGRAATDADLAAVWGSDADGLFAVGDHVLLFFDGAVWRRLLLDGGPQVGPDDFLAIDGVPGGEIVVTGERAVITYEGAAWSPTFVPTVETIRAMWGTAPDDVFAVGTGGVILHHDGLSWTPQDSGTSAALTAVWGAASDDVYAVGEGGVVLHYDGDVWAEVASPTTQDLMAVWTIAGGPLVIGGEEGLFYRDGQVWTNPVPGEQVEEVWIAVWGIDASSLWGARSFGDLWHFDGVAWAAVDPFSGPQYVSDFHGRDPSQIYGVGVGSWQYGGGTWMPGPFAEPPDNPSDGPLYGGVWDSATVGVFAVGQDGRIERFDGTATESIRGRTTTPLSDVFIAGRVVFMSGADGIQMLVFHR